MVHEGFAIQVHLMNTVCLTGLAPQTSSCKIGSLFFLQDILAIYLYRNCLCITVVGRGKAYPLFREACSPKPEDPEAPGDCLEKDLHCQPHY